MLISPKENRAHLGDFVGQPASTQRVAWGSRPLRRILKSAQPLSTSALFMARNKTRLPRMDFAILPRIGRFPVRVHALSSKNSSVQEDWRARPPGHKAEAFAAHVRQFDTRYAMLSVSLNEAIEQRRS